MIKEVLSYLYVNAKVMAKEGRFISPMRWDDLWGCASPAEVASLLEGTDYFAYLSEGAMHEAEELEKAILGSKVADYPEKIRGFFEENRVTLFGIAVKDFIEIIRIALDSQ